MELLLETWWQGMLVAEKVYWIIAIPFTLIFLAGCNSSYRSLKWNAQYHPSQILHG
jgi:hypothetical protein